MPASLPRKLSPGFSRFLAALAVSVLFGLAWFLLLHGRYPLYFSHVDWIYSFGSDTLQHHLGWEWFRQDPWRFPLGSIQSYGYPSGTFLSYLDSIPLFAIPFKLLSPLLGARFQYLGLWELTSVIMQFLAGMLILGEFTRSYPLRILGASLLVLSPPMILRTFHHNSLTAQWILLAGIWFILLEYRQRLWRWAWPALFAVAMLVHLYFAAMLLPLWGVGLYFRYSRGRLNWRLGVDILVVTGVLLLTGYSIGLFSLNTGDLVKFGFGLYSWNLNGLVNPLQYSSILSEMAVVSDRQHEGFSYLGLGNLLILPTAVFLFLQNDWSRRKLYFFLPLAACCLALLPLCPFTEGVYRASACLGYRCAGFPVQAVLPLPCLRALYLACFLPGGAVWNDQHPAQLPLAGPCAWPGAGAAGYRFAALDRHPQI